MANGIVDAGSVFRLKKLSTALGEKKRIAS
jgi:hypothetical protein